MSNELLTKHEVGARLRISPGTVSTWVREARIPCVRIAGNRLRFDWDEVVAALRTDRDSAPPTGDAGEVRE